MQNWNLLSIQIELKRIHVVHIQGSIVSYAQEGRENGGVVMVAVVVCVCVHRWGQARWDGIGLEICSGLFSPLTLMLGN